jgi:Fur family ferric uptake transcriptional regulator
MKKLDEFKQELQSHGLRVTKSRISVFSVLVNNQHKFLSPDEILEKINQSNLDQCDRASVYRVLSSLEEIGLVKSSQFQGEATKYQVHFHTSDCNNCQDEHEHYFKCIQCETIEPIGECLFDKNLQELSKKGYVTLSHHFEVSGYCPQCK